MRHDYLVAMSDKELDGYADVMGIDVTGIADHAAKIDKIESTRNRIATVRACGLELHIPIKVLHDKRLIDKYADGALTNTKLENFIYDLVGDKQMEAIRERCTDEDGTVDTDGYLFILNAINESSELKNF
ncbi:hypothetical protein ACUYFE_07925 [Olegusella massiliensis]|uniref:hypothetical protein n=1 Tax=Olegusella massiliensis TaxID=1776381 RepID=UPI0040553E68